MRLFLFIFFSLFSTLSFAQDPDLEQFYPYNNLFKITRVKKLLYNNHEVDLMNSTTQYDTLGREINYFESPNLISFVYNQVGDTLIRKGYGYKQNKEEYLNTVEKYVFNKKRQIVSYFACRRKTEGRTASLYKKLVYDNSGKVISIFHYKTSNYPFSFSTDFPINLSLYKLMEIEKYYYKTSGKLLYKESKEFEENPDKEKVKITYTYTDSSIVIQQFVLNRNGRRIKSETNNISEFVKNNIGLYIRKYDLTNSKRKLSESYEYEFH